MLVVADNAVRRDFQYGVDLMTAIFELPVSDNLPNYHVVEAAGNYSIVQLQAIADGVLIPGNAQQVQYVRSIANSAAATEQSGLVASLREQADIQVFEEQISRIP